MLQEQLRQTQDRFNVGEVTRTDVAQAEASLAGARRLRLTRSRTLQASLANYRQAIGDEPKSLAPVAPSDEPTAQALPEAIAISQVEHPAIVAMLHGVDAAALGDQDRRGRALSDGRRDRVRSPSASTSPAFPAGSQVLATR